MANCPKCSGRLFPEQHHSGLRLFDGLKCLNCGTYVDPVIQANQLKNHLPLEPADKADGREALGWRSRFEIEIDHDWPFGENQGT